MEPLTSVPGWTETDYREGDEATENQTDLLNYKWRQPSGRVARKASLVHNPGVTVNFPARDPSAAGANTSFRVYGNRANDARAAESI
jgi:hypothetical protein